MLSFPPPPLRRLLFYAVTLWGIIPALGGCRAEVDTAGERAAPKERPPSILPPLKNIPTKESGRPSVSREAETTAAAPSFRNVAARLGVNFSFHTDAVPDRYFLPEIMGGGVGCLDYDRDGWIDLYFPNGSRLIPGQAPTKPSPRNAFYRNRGGLRFDQVAEQAALDHPGYGQGCAVADYDADGFPDLYLTNYGENVLYHNNGDGTFSPVDSDVLGGSHRWSTSAAFVDVNLDGWVDLYVANYLNATEENLHSCDYDGITGYCGPGEFDALPDEVFLNLGDGRFEEAADRLGLRAENGKGLAVSVLDFDNDLVPEIYVANDMTENFLFSRSRMDPAPSASKKTPYSNVAPISGCAVSESGLHEASMGIACADFDLDHLPDIYLTHFYHQKNTLYHNRGNLVFSDDSRRFRVVAHSNDYLGFGVAALDYDSNGTVDLFVANGHVLGPNYQPSQMLPQLLANVKGKGFEDVSSAAGDYFAGQYLGRGAAGVDFDNDGDTDIVVSHLDHPAAVLSNQTERVYETLGLILEDRSRNAPVGGRVIIETPTYRRTYFIGSGGSYLSSPDPRLLVPVPPKADGSHRVEIYWTSGTVAAYDELTSGRYWLLREGREPLTLPAGRWPEGEAGSGKP